MRTLIWSNQSSLAYTDTNQIGTGIPLVMASYRLDDFLVPESAFFFVFTTSGMMNISVNTSTIDHGIHAGIAGSTVMLIGDLAVQFRLIATTKAVKL